MSLRLIGALLLTAVLAYPVSIPNPFKKKAKANAPAAVSQTQEQPSVKPAKKAEIKEEPKGFASTFTGGTVAYIPRYSDGHLDLSDRTSLKFQYGQPSWSLAYNRITSIEIADRKVSKLIKIPVFSRERRVLNITFLTEKGRSGNLQLEVDTKDSVELLPLLESRTGKTVAVAGAIDPDGWWGDKFWRTSANKASWDQRTQDAKAAAPPQAQE